MMMSECSSSWCIALLFALLQSEGLSSNRANFHTLAESNSRDHTACSLC